MRFTVHKIFFIWDYDKEEKWLNDMAAIGRNLISASFFRFVFEEGNPGEYEYHLEWMKHMPNHPESIRYRQFLEETGFEEVATFKKWLFIRKNSSEMAYSLFSDIDSRLEHLQRIMLIIPILFCTLFLYMCFEFSILIAAHELLPTLVVVAVIFFLMLTLLGYGFIKTIKAYRVLKKERLVRE